MNKSDDQLEYERLQEQIEASHNRIRRMENEVKEMRHFVDDHYKNCLTRNDKKKVKEETQ